MDYGSVDKERVLPQQEQSKGDQYGSSIQERLLGGGVPSTDNREQKSVSVVRFRVTSVLVPVLFFAGFVPFSTLLPEYLLHRLNVEAGVNSTQAKQTGPCSGNGSNSRQKEATDLVLQYSYAQNGPALLVCLFLGGFTDVLGRRIFVIMGTASGFLKLLLTSFIIKFNLPLWLFYVAHAIDGMAGSWYVIFMGLYTGVADVFPLKASKVFWIAVIGTSTSIDSSMFLILSGYIVDALGFFWASLLGTMVSGLSVVVAVLVLPETYFPKKGSKLSVLLNLKRVSGFFFSGGTLRQRIRLSLCVAAFFFAIINITGPTTADVLYQQREPFCWNAISVGMYAAERMAGQYTLATISLKVLLKCISVEWIAVIGSALQTGAFIFEAFISVSWQFVLVPLIGFLGTTAVPVLRGVMSSLVSEHDQGAMFSSIAMFEVACQLFGNTVLLRVYSATVGYFPGLIYLLLAGFSLISLTLIVIFQFIRDDSQNYEKLVESPGSIENVAAKDQDPNTI